MQFNYSAPLLVGSVELLLVRHAATPIWMYSPGQIPVSLPHVLVCGIPLHNHSARLNARQKSN